MGNALRLPRHAWVLVADGRKAILLANEGDELHPKLEVRQAIDAPPNPPTHEQGADRPGHVQFGMRRSAVEETDWHRQGEDRFAAALVEALFGTEAPRPLVLVAPPRFLAALRKLLPARMKRQVVAEVDRDLTHLPVAEIERTLTGG